MVRNVKDVATDRSLLQAPPSMYMKEMIKARKKLSGSCKVYCTMYVDTSLKILNILLHDCHAYNIQYFCTYFGQACKAATNIGNAGFMS